MIVNIRATHGAGKSYLIGMMMDKFKTIKRDINHRGKAQNYSMIIPGVKGKTYLIGTYEITCGGCDAIQPYSEIWPRVERFAKLGHVIFEGALVSSSYGSIGTNSEKYGDDFVFAFLDTPLKECIRRIEERRRRRGNNKPLDPKNTINKYRSVERSKQKMRERNRKIITLPYEDPIPTLVSVLKGEL